MDGFAAFNKRVMAACARGAEVVGNLEVEHIRTDIGIPVEYLGNRVVRSLPDEPPRKETGRLQESIKSRVLQGADRVELVVSAGPAINPQDGQEYSAALELGTSRVLPRPYMGPSFERMIGGAARPVVDELNKLR